MLMRYVIKAYLVLLFVLFAVAVLDIIIAQTPFTELYAVIQLTAATVLVIWSVATLLLLGWGLWHTLFRT